jgi:hypothetical protein
MLNKAALTAIIIAAFAVSAAAQTVTGSGTANTIPMFTGTSTIGNSAITQSTTGDVLINGNSSLRTTFQVTGPATIGTEMDLGNTDTGGKNWGWVPNGNAYPTYFPETSGCMSLHDASDGSYPAEFCQTFITLFQNVGINTSATPAAALEVNGTVQIDTTGTNGLTFSGASGTQTTPWTGVLCGGDYAEAVNAKGSLKLYQPGDVLVIGDGAKGEVQKSAKRYSTMVAGIFATKPGVIGRRQTLLKEDEEIPMAMIGIVPTKVTAENGAIHRGDLLVTSSLSGYAMKGTDRNRLVGAVIGKAMGTLDKGTGVIEVLVTLQ